MKRRVAASRHRASEWLVTRKVSLVIVLAVVLALALAGAAFAAFPDVGANHPYIVAVTSLSDRGVISGFDDGTFGPDNLVKRMQFAKMIVLDLGFPVTTSDICTFKDVDPSSNPADPLYPDHFVAVASSRGLIMGYPEDNTFRPGKQITRRQVVTMVVRAAGTKLSTPPAGWKGVLDYSDPTHGENIRIAEYNHLLDGLVGLGATWDSGAFATRGECAQVLYNLSKLITPSDALPTFADLKPAGPVGFTFTINTPQIFAAEHEQDGVWPATLTPGTITGHMTVQTVAVSNGAVTVKLTIDSLTVPENQFFSQTDVDPSLPAYVLLRVDSEGTVLGISYATKGKSEQALDQTTVAGLATFLTPITSALMLPYSGQSARPGAQLGVSKSYSMLGKKIMDVDTKLNYTSFSSGVADLAFNIATTNIDIPLSFDMAPFLPLLGYEVPPNVGPLTMSLNVGTTITASGDYDLDTASGLPTGMTLSSTMMLDAYIHHVPPQLLLVWPNSDFAHGWVDHAYLRGADHTSPITVTLTLTKDAAH